jgi:hypothetical protein
LTDHGHVVTFRESRRAEPNAPVGIREERNGSDLFVAECRELDRIDAADGFALAPFRAASGFDSVEDWQHAIREQAGVLSEGWLYAVYTDPEADQ